MYLILTHSPVTLMVLNNNTQKFFTASLSFSVTQSKTVIKEDKETRGQGG
ncbi:MAG: hypothetical protein KME31_24455 [Tolypothrix carrinoi HA7290-LM1]|nr:hypothetical protein [Tolypothrix carrinoi HA7290-LM1]